MQIILPKTPRRRKTRHTMPSTGKITHCIDCKQPLATPGEHIGGIPVGSICDECDQKRLEEYQARNPGHFQTPEEKLKKKWANFLVEFPDYRDTDTSFLWPKQYQEAIAWYPKNPEGKGLLLTGKSGAGKSRTLFQVMAKCIDYQIFPTYYAAEELARKISDSWDRRGKLEQIVNHLIRVPILAIDDLGQEKLTARVEESWYAIIRGRCEHRKPILATTMYSDDRLAQRFSHNPEQGIAIVRRLKEYTEVIPYPQPLPKYSIQGELAV